MNLEPLRQHPHVVEAIKAMWGHPECDIYLTKIMIQDRMAGTASSPTCSRR